MEPEDVKEIEEQAEEGASHSMQPVALTMSIIAVILAVITMLGERAHTAAIINQAKASDQWNLYQSKKNRAHISGKVGDMVSVIAPKNPGAAEEIEKDKKYVEKEKDDQGEEQEIAVGFEEKVEHAELLGDRFNLAQVLLQIALVITSITLLTRSKIYWYFGFVFSAADIAAALSVLLIK